MADFRERGRILKAIEFARTSLKLDPLKEKQVEALYAFVSGQDTFVMLPTGYGKSVIYTILPILFDHLKETEGSIVVCVSPLTSLMMDQQRKASERLICQFVGQGQKDDLVIDEVLQGKVQLLFISPENLVNNSLYRTMLLGEAYKDKLVALVVDEAHCVDTWGDDFRMSFAAIGTIRSLIPENTNIMALTATATKSTFDKVVTRLSMQNVVTVGASPMRSNIRYSVYSMTSMNEFCAKVAGDIMKEGICYPKTVIFCQRYSDCSSLYSHLKVKLGEHLTHPIGTIDLQEFRLVDIYTAASTLQMREKLLSSFIEVGSTVRILIATMAFGMGIDCKDIRQIIHWSPPVLAEDYVQETGRAGRDGHSCEAALIFGSVKREVSLKMREYGRNTDSCRRQTLFADFLFTSDEPKAVAGCNCCDVCAGSCTCGQCRPFLDL